jgi:hypothetical protein
MERFLRPSPRAGSGGGSPFAGGGSPSASGGSPPARWPSGPVATSAPGGGGGGGAGPGRHSGSAPSRLGPPRAGDAAAAGNGAAAAGGDAAGGGDPVAAAAAAAAAAAGAPARRRGAQRGLVRPREAWDGAAAGADAWADMAPVDEEGLEALAGLGPAPGGPPGPGGSARAVCARHAPPACQLDSIQELLVEVDRGAHRGAPSPPRPPLPCCVTAPAAARVDAWVHMRAAHASGIV